MFRLLRDELTASDGLAVLVFEDVRWADEASLDLIQFLSRRVRDCRLLILTTYRTTRSCATTRCARCSAESARRWARRLSIRLPRCGLDPGAGAGCGRQARVRPRRQPVLRP